MHYRRRQRRPVWTRPLLKSKKKIKKTKMNVRLPKDTTPICAKRKIARNGRLLKDRETTMIVGTTYNTVPHTKHGHAPAQASRRLHTDRRTHHTNSDGHLCI